MGTDEAMMGGRRYDFPGAMLVTPTGAMKVVYSGACDWMGVNGEPEL